MSDSVGSGFPSTGINQGHLFYDFDELSLWMYIGGGIVQLDSSWRLLSGRFNVQPDTTLWGLAQAGAQWFLTSDQLYYGWDGTQIVLIGGGLAGYGTFQQNGVSVVQRSILNVVGRDALVDDSGGVTRFRMNDPSTMSYVKDDFIGGSTALFTGVIGEMGWFGNQSGTGNILQPTLLITDISHPGVKRLSTGAGLGAFAFIHLPSTASFNLILIDNNFDVLFIVNLRNNDVNTRALCGLSTGALPFALSGVRIEKDLTDTDWFAFTGDGVGITRTSLGAIVVGQWEKFRIRRVDATTIGFTRNAQAEILISTSMLAPATGLGLHAYIENNAAADKNLDVDYVDMLVTGLVR